MVKFFLSQKGINFNNLSQFATLCFGVLRFNQKIFNLLSVTGEEIAAMAKVTTFNNADQLSETIAHAKIIILSGYQIEDRIKKCLSLNLTQIQSVLPNNTWLICQSRLDANLARGIWSASQTHNINVIIGHQSQGQNNTWCNAVNLPLKLSTEVYTTTNTISFARSNICTAAKFLSIHQNKAIIISEMEQDVMPLHNSQNLAYLNGLITLATTPLNNKWVMDLMAFVCTFGGTQFGIKTITTTKVNDYKNLHKNIFYTGNEEALLDHIFNNLSVPNFVNQDLLLGAKACLTVHSPQDAIKKVLLAKQGLVGAPAKFCFNLGENFINVLLLSTMGYKTNDIFTKSTIKQSPISELESLFKEDILFYLTHNTKCTQVVKQLPSNTNVSTSKSVSVVTSTIPQGFTFSPTNTKLLLRNPFAFYIKHLLGGTGISLNKIFYCEAINNYAGVFKGKEQLRSKIMGNIMHEAAELIIKGSCEDKTISYLKKKHNLGMVDSIYMQKTITLIKQFLSRLQKMGFTTFEPEKILQYNLGQIKLECRADLLCKSPSTTLAIDYKSSVESFFPQEIKGERVQAMLTHLCLGQNSNFAYIVPEIKEGTIKEDFLSKWLSSKNSIGDLPEFFNFTIEQLGRLINFYCNNQARFIFYPTQYNPMEEDILAKMFTSHT